MGNFLFVFVLPLLLLAGSFANWSLISLIDLVGFLVLKYIAHRRGFSYQSRSQATVVIVIFSVVTIISQSIFHIIWLFEGDEWSMQDAWWAQLVGFVWSDPWDSRGSIIFTIVIHLAICVVALLQSYISWHQQSRWWETIALLESWGSHLRVACCLVLPAVQLIAGISHPSWASLPFFVCSCISLVLWSLSSNFLVLFWWWRHLLIYAAFSILLLYVYQLPIQFPGTIEMAADFLGLYKVSKTLDWVNAISAVCLIMFYFILLSVRCDLEEMDCLMSSDESNLTEELLPSKHSFFIRQSRFGVKHVNMFLKGAVFHSFSINFFTYGFPVVFLALTFWSFSFASICAFGLLSYVGYILCSFPSLLHLHRLNGLLLVFILLWAISTYVFNVAFAFLNKELWQDMKVWETVGLWHYSIPGLYLLAQFCLGILVAMGNLVNNSVFLYLSDGDNQSTSSDPTAEENQESKVLIVATIAWGLCKSSRAITLLLIFVLGTKPGLIHAIYMVFFLAYILSHTASRKMRQYLIILCEVHFAFLYILSLNMISQALENEQSFVREILSVLGLLNHATFWDFVKIAVLLGFCTVQNHGFETLLSLSAILQKTSYTPFGFSILRAGLNKSVLLSVYASPNACCRDPSGTSNIYEKLVTSYLSAIGAKILSTYRSYGTYVAFLTILITIYLVVPNYISFGYLLFLEFWIIGRQILGKSRRSLWLPLKGYALLVFVLTYSLSICPSFEVWVSQRVNLYPDLGFNPDASLLHNIWESLAVLIVMQLYSYERRQSRFTDCSMFSESHGGGLTGFMKRLLIWHSEKILSVCVFYASLSPISVAGFVYLVAIVVCSVLPKASRLPSKMYLVFTGTLVALEYLFQMFGREAETLPGQKYATLATLLGFQLFTPGFWGVEKGLRGKVLVFVACILQYNVFHWLDNMPTPPKNVGKWEEPCRLFVPPEQFPSATFGQNEERQPSTVNPETSNTAGVFGRVHRHHAEDPVNIGGGFVGEATRSCSSSCGLSDDCARLNKKPILAMKKARFNMQMTCLKTFLKYWIENFFYLFGLEINMIMLLLASFALLNVVSLFYILCLVACILLNRQIIRKLWPIFFFLFAFVLIVEYLAVWENLLSVEQGQPRKSPICCHECWKSSNTYFDYCTRCWLGITVDDLKMLISYYLVFLLASFKLRSDHLVNGPDAPEYHQMTIQRNNPLIWGDLSFEIKNEWTIIDYIKLYAYCHLLDVVLALVLIIGTLEYDLLHLGYLGFALVFFRMRVDILKKDKIFKFLRFYNFAVIVLSLAYQSPFLGDANVGRCDKVDYIYEVIGFYKYDYGFRITSRSALVEIIIFMLVSVQSYIFRIREFKYIRRHIEIEQIDAVWRARERKAAWKTAQLQHIRRSEEERRQRNSQVEKMKAEVLELQNQLHNITSNDKCASLSTDGKSSPRVHLGSSELPTDKLKLLTKRIPNPPEMSNVLVFGAQESPRGEAQSQASPEHQTESGELLEASHTTFKSLDSSVCEITEVEDKSKYSSEKLRTRDKQKIDTKENPLISAVHLIGDGVSQVQSLGTQAVTNIVSFLEIENEESDSTEYSSANDMAYEESENQRNTENIYCNHLAHTSSVRSSSQKVVPPAQIGKVFQYMWMKMQTNINVLCYSFFILMFLWNFSLLSMVYLAALFLYALYVNPSPNHTFWLMMLIYTEFNILAQYFYQITIQHCGLNLNSTLLQRLGFPENKIMSSFVISTLPLFLVYIATLLQTSVTARNGDYIAKTGFKDNEAHNDYERFHSSTGWRVQLKHLLLRLMSFFRLASQSISRYWESLTKGSESPPYFVQLSIKVDVSPADEIQLDRIESGVNMLLEAAHLERWNGRLLNSSQAPSRVRVQSIERSPENSDIVLAVFEVVYASSLKDCPTTDRHACLTPASDVASEILRAQSLGLCEELGFPYPIVSVIAGGKKEIDLYAYIFGADLVTFFLVAIFYQSAIKNNSKFLDVYQLEDQFPKEFVFVLMILFFLIVLDRIIYLCSFATGKVFYYWGNLVLFTYSATEYAWFLELANQQIGGLALRAIYLTKAVSLVLQAIQIKYGVPNKGTLYRQFLTSKVTQFNHLGFRLYRALPFLYELRCVLDWSCTTTSLTMYDWLKLEDINASLYLVKCDADLNRAKHMPGEKQTKMTKFCSGICLFFILICVIWAPMLMYSSGNPTNIANPVKDVTVQIDVKTPGGRLTLYQTTLCELIPWEELLVDGIDLDPHGYLEMYNVDDIQLICCQADASSSWLLPPAVQLKFMRSLDKNMQLIFSWFLIRDRPKGKEVVKYENLVEDPPPDPLEFKNVFNGTVDSVRIDGVYRRYFRVTGSGEVRILEQAVDMFSGDLVLNRKGPHWWSFHNTDASEVKGCKGLGGPTVIIVSEETPQGLLGETLSKFSIWSLYLTFVLAVGRFIRLQCSDLRMRIPFENLPSCDRLIAICENIYAARAEGELEVEEVLYWTLVNIYRSPHMLLEYTKPD